MFVALKHDGFIFQEGKSLSLKNAKPSWSFFPWGIDSLFSIEFVQNKNVNFRSDLIRERILGCIHLKTHFLEEGNSFRKS